MSWLAIDCTVARACSRSHTGNRRRRRRASRAGTDLRRDQRSRPQGATRSADPGREGSHVRRGLPDGCRTPLHCHGLSAPMRSALSLVSVLLAAALLAGPAVGIASSASASPAATRVVDRTLLCRVGYSGGARLLLLTAQSAARSGDKLEWLAHATVSTPGNPLSRQNAEPTLAGVTRRLAAAAALHVGWARVRQHALRSEPCKGAVLAQGAHRAASPTRSGRICAASSANRCWSASARRSREPVVEEPNKAGDFVSALGRMTTGQIAVRTLDRQAARLRRRGGRRPCAALHEGMLLRAVAVIAAAAALALSALGGGSAGACGGSGDADPRPDIHVRGLLPRRGVPARQRTRTPAPGGAARGRGSRTPASARACSRARQGTCSCGSRPDVREKTTVVDQDYDTFDVATFGTVGVRRESCRRTSGPVVLSPSGLRGGVGCAARQRVRVLRAEAGHRPRAGSPRRAGSPESRAGLRDRARSGARGEARGPHGHGQADSSMRTFTTAARHGFSPQGLAHRNRRIDGDNGTRGLGAGQRGAAPAERRDRRAREDARRSGSCLTALVCGGHVLLEDVPGTAKTVLARAIAGSVDGRGVLTDPVHARPPADRRHGPVGLQPARPRLRVPARARCSRTSCSSTRSTARCRRRSRRCSRRWPSSR